MIWPYAAGVTECQISESACGVRIWPQSRRSALARLRGARRSAPERTGAHWRASAARAGAHRSAPARTGAPQRCPLERTGAQAGVRELRQRSPACGGLHPGRTRRAALCRATVCRRMQMNTLFRLFTICLPKSMATAQVTARVFAVLWCVTWCLKKVACL